MKSRRVERAGLRGCFMGVLNQVEVQRERMFHAVPDGRCAVAQKAPQVSGGGARDNGVGLLRLTVFEDASALEHEAATPAADSSIDLLETYKACRAVATIHHEVLDLRLRFDIAGVGLGHPGASEFWPVRALAVRLFIPALDGEPGICGLLHVPFLQRDFHRPPPRASISRSDSRLTKIFA